MPVVLSDLAHHEQELEVATPVGPVAIRYRPNAMTPAMEADLARAATGEGMDVLLRTFCAVVSWIDVVGPLADEQGKEVLAAGEPLPVAPEYVRFLPSRLLTAIFAEVQDDQTGGKAKRNGSSGGSFSRA